MFQRTTRSIDGVAISYSASGTADTAVVLIHGGLADRSFWNGDLFPPNIDANRKFLADFDAVVLPHTGHFPMLKRPDEFNRRLAELL